MHAEGEEDAGGACCWLGESSCGLSEPLSHSVFFFPSPQHMKRVINLFELPRRLGILQFVECETPCCVLTAEGYKRGVCLRYRVCVTSCAASL